MQNTILISPFAYRGEINSRDNECLQAVKRVVSKLSPPVSLLHTLLILVAGLGTF